MGRFRDVELDNLELSGERLTLRRWSSADADRVHQVMQDPGMSRYLALPHPYTREDAHVFVTEIGHEGRGDGSGLGSAVIERESGRLVGACALRLTNDPEIGYWVAPDARGRAYAAEATQVLARFGFDIGLHRVRLACDVRNVASVATALSAGFRFEGVARGGVTSDGHGVAPARHGDLARFGRLAGDSGERIAYAFPGVPTAGLSDGVLTLRVLRPDDATGLAQSEDELTVRWNFTGTPRTREAMNATAARGGLDWLVGNAAHFAMVDDASGAFAGELMLRKVGPPQVYGIGYTVHPHFRGRGFTTRALRIVAQWAFDQADVARLELGAKTANVASQRAAAKAGFAADGTRHARLRNPDGTFSDEVRFALVNPRYAPRRSSP